MDNPSEATKKLADELAAHWGDGPCGCQNKTATPVVVLIQRALDAAAAEAIERAARTASINVVRRVAELPDRTSPDDWPEAMLVTSDELATIVEESIRALAPKQAEQGMACMVPADDNSGRRCNKPTGHDGDHWTYGGATKTWPQEPASRLCECERYFVPCPVCVPKQAEQPDHEFLPRRPGGRLCDYNYDPEWVCGLPKSAHRRAEEKR